MQKYFKIVTKIILNVIFTLLLIFSTAFFALQTKYVQNLVGKQVIKILSYYFETNIKVDKVTYPFFNKINLKNFCIYDLRGDTLIFAEKITTNFKYNFKEKKIIVTKLVFSNSFINFVIDTSNNLNLGYFIKKLSSKKENSNNNHRLSLNLNDLKILNSRFYLTDFNNNLLKEDSTINFSKLKLEKLNIDIDKFKEDDSVCFTINKLSFKEISGFEVDNLSCKFKIYKKFLKFDNIEILTKNSSINANHVYILFNNFKDFKSDKIFENVNFLVKINSGQLSFNDLSYFVKLFKGSKQKVEIKGNFSGPLGRFKGRDIFLSAGKHTKIELNFNIDGLPNIEEMYAFIDIRKLITNFNDVLLFDIPGKKFNKVPDFLREAGNINFKGQFTGFYNDFVAYGVLKSNFGTIKTDMLLKPKNKDEIFFNGLLKTENYDIGKLLKNKELGKFTFELNTSGISKHFKAINATLDGIIKYVEYKNYQYNNINVSGSIKNKVFSGKIDVKDKNIDFKLEGIFNFSKNAINYDIVADVAYLNLYNLNIDKKEREQTVSFKFKSLLEGNSINTINGYLEIYDFKAKKPDNLLIIDDIKLKIYNTDNSNSIILISDFLNANLEGKYKLNEIRKNIYQFLNFYSPALFSQKYKKDELNLDKCFFNINLDIFDLQSIIDYFNKDIFISSGIKVNGHFSNILDSVNVYFTIPSFASGNKFIKNIDFKLFNEKDTLKYNAHIDNLLISKEVGLENLSFSGDIFNDTLIALIQWNNQNKNFSRGYIPFIANFLKDTQIYDNKVMISLNFMNSYLIVKDNLWNISPSNFVFGKNYLSISNLFISNKNQFLKAYGTIGNELSNNIVEVDIKNFNIKNIWDFISYTKGIDGIVTGNFKFTGTISKPILNAEINIDSLTYQEEKLGKVNIISTWNNENKELSINSYLERGNLKTFIIEGKLYPEKDNKIDLELYLDKLRLETFLPNNNIFYNTKGFLNGNLQITGNLKKPIINGDLYCQRVIFEFMPLKTKYTFTDNVKISNNVLKFDNLVLLDKDGNTGRLNGYIDINNFSNLIMSLNFNIRNFHVLNTSFQDNSSFFGEVYATGIVNIQGTQKNINIDIKAKTETNSKFYIYLEDKENLSSYDFVYFIHGNEKENSEISLEDKFRNLKGGLDINIDAEITPEAEIQIIFNPLTGDIIKGRGNGNLNIQFHKEKFNIYGLYNIESGEYSFNLMNVINRKFVLREGSTIFFNGRPLDANLNIIAYYRTKASLGELFGNIEEVQQKTTVDCQIIMSGKLSQPNIKYDIYLPNVEESTRDNVKSKINTSEELLKQFTSLLVLNRFVPSMTSTTDNTSNTFTSYAYTAGINPGDLITSQLSNWLSQLNEDLNVGVNLRSNKQLKTEEIELMLSTQLLNDRLLIQGNVDVPTNAAARASNRLVGDVEIEYKINKTGKLRAKAFNRSNEDQLNILSPYTQGIGIVYREEFDSPIELFKRIFKSKKDKNKN